LSNVYIDTLQALRVFCQFAGWHQKA